MNFTQTFENLDCNCIEESNEDIQNNYAIKTNKEQLRLQDFNSKHDKGKIPDSDKCEKVCSFRGVSISLYNDKTKDYVLNVYKQLFPLSPGYKPFVKIFKFGNECGNVKHTPSNNNDYHFDFYKCDTFAIENIEVKETKELHNV